MSRIREERNSRRLPGAGAGRRSLAALCEAGLDNSVVELAPLDRLQTRAFLVSGGGSSSRLGDAKDFESGGGGSHAERGGEKT